MNPRYSRNISTLSIEENESLKNYTVCVIGCGGLGGYVIEMLGRIGIGRIIAVDGDSFDESNLNRQILSRNSTLGKKKAIEAKERMQEVNDLVEVDAVTVRLNEENGNSIIKDADIVVDALDNIETRLLLEKICEEEGKPLIHGAIAGWYGQVTTIFPGDKTLSKFYEGKNLVGEEKKLGNPSFTPAIVAATEVSEVIKLLIKRGQTLRNRLLLIDLLNQDFEVVEIK